MMLPAVGAPQSPHVSGLERGVSSFASWSMSVERTCCCKVHVLAEEECAWCWTRGQHLMWNVLPSASPRKTRRALAVLCSLNITYQLIAKIAFILTVQVPSPIRFQTVQ